MHQFQSSSRDTFHESPMVVNNGKSMSWDGTADADNSLEFLLDGCSSLFEGEQQQLPELDELRHICEIFEKGVKVTCRKYYRRLKLGGGSSIFTGSDAVSFLVDNRFANSREKALRIGRMMAYEFALFRHETNDYDLEDANGLFYKFIPPDQRVINSPLESHGLATLNTIADAFEEGVVVGPNVHKNRTFKNTFIGSSAVTFLVSSQLAKTRQDAVRIGQLIMEERGLFQHVGKKHKFKDKHLLYRFVRPHERHLQECISNYRDAIPIEETAEHFIAAVKPGNAFSGSSAVDAMIAAGMAASRSEAILLGEKLMSAMQLFHSVRGRERAFFDRGDIFYEYHKGNKRASSSLWLGNNVVDKQPHSGDCAEYLVDKIDSVMGIVDFDEKQSTVTERAANNSEECTSFFDTGQIDLDYLLGFGDGSNIDAEDSPKESSLIRARSYDKFGFILENEEEKGDRDGSAVSSDDCNYNVKTTEKELSMEEWSALLDSCAMADSGEPPSVSQNTVKRMMRIGLPDELRRRAWTVITGVDVIVQERCGDYQSFVETATLFMKDENNFLLDGGQPLKGVIERDLHRTFPRHCLFCNRNANGVEGTVEVPIPSDGMFTDTNSADPMPDGLMRLRRVLYAYSLYDNEVGYCQGMNFIAAMFLTFLSEEESFWLLVAVMNGESYNMRNLFAEDMSGVHESIYVTEKIFQKFLPKLHKHMEKEHVRLSMFATQWLMTLFTSTFPFDLVARVWDSYIVEGWKVVYRVVLSLLEHAQNDLIDLNLEEILTYLRDEFPSKIDGASVMKASLKIPLRHKQIRKYTSEWRAARNGQNNYARSDSGESGDSRFSRLPIKQLIRRTSSVGKRDK